MSEITTKLADDDAVMEWDSQTSWRWSIVTASAKTGLPLWKVEELGRDLQDRIDTLLKEADDE